MSETDVTARRQPGGATSSPGTGRHAAEPHPGGIFLGGESSDPFWAQDQDVLNALLMSEIGRDDVEFDTLEWVDWFNHRRLLEPIGHVPPAEFEAAYRSEEDSDEAATLRDPSLR